MSNNKKVARRERRIQQQRTKQNRNLIVAVGALLFVGILVFFTWQQSGGGNALAADAVPDPVLGPADAVVEIVEFADFGCPACRAWHQSGVREQVTAVYGDQVRFVWKDFPVITSQSPKAAEAGHCAGAQGKFWEYHDRVYEHHAGLRDSNLQAYAAAVALDMTAFNTCLDDGLMVRKVRANEQAARQAGIRGTPGFTFNGRPLPGPPSFDMLSTLIEAELGKG